VSDPAGERFAARPESLGRRRFPGAGLPACLGFWWMVLGFLTPAALAGPIDDALSCLDTQAAAVEFRDDLLGQADSLGYEIASAQRVGASTGRLQREAEKVNRRAFELELEIANLRARCRPRLEEALRLCRDEIVRLSREAAGEGSAPGSRPELLRLREARDRIEQALAGPAVIGYPLLPADSTDTQETLLAKLRYHEDVRGYLAALDERLGSRLQRLTEERRVLLEAEQFLRDEEFLDEGGRVSPGGRAVLRGGNQGGGDPNDPRKPIGSAPLGGEANLDALLGFTPRTTSESDRLLESLKEFRRRIRQELEEVDGVQEQLRRRILATGPARR